MSKIRKSVWLCLLLTYALGCGDDDAIDDAGPTIDTAPADVEQDDVFDSAVSDTMVSDSAVSDTSPGDARIVDAAVTDAVGADVGVLDAGDCGNGVCDDDEDAVSCPADCGCACDLRDGECDIGCECDSLCPSCHIGGCEGDVATTCDASLTFDCRTIGAVCRSFIDGETLDSYRWCGCGTLNTSDVICLSNTEYIACGAGGTNGVGLRGACSPGTRCISGGGGGCICDNAADGICGAERCTSDPDCMACAPSCGGAVCGDNGCGGECGVCPFGRTCVDSACVVP